MRKTFMFSKCRWCGKPFAQYRRANLKDMVMHSLCPQCRDVQAKRARGIDARFANVGGHAWMEDFACRRVAGGAR